MTRTQKISRNVTIYFTADDLDVATVWYQGGWNVRLAHSPDEFSIQRTATREYAEALAIRHANLIGA